MNINRCIMGLVQVTAIVAILTAGYATGQLIDPLVSSASVSLTGSLHVALIIAALGLIAGGLVLVVGIGTAKHCPHDPQW